MSDSVTSLPPDSEKNTAVIQFWTVAVRDFSCFQARICLHFSDWHTKLSTRSSCYYITTTTAAVHHPLPELGDYLAFWIKDSKLCGVSVMPGFGAKSGSRGSPIRT